MEPNYSVNTKLTEEEFVRFNRLIMHRNKKLMAIIIGCGLIVLAYAIENLIKGQNMAMSLGLLCGSLVFIWVYTFGADRKARKYYKQNVEKESTEQRIDFYDDHFEQTTANANTNIPYSLLSAIYITKTNVYMMRSPVVGYVLPLNDCPEGFVEFIKKIKGQNNI